MKMEPFLRAKALPYLFMEADGINISLQREKERKAEIKGGIAYQGWEEIGNRRYKLKGKSVYAGIMDGKRFWEGGIRSCPGRKGNSWWWCLVGKGWC